MPVDTPVLPSDLRRSASSFLDDVYSRALALYPFTTSARDGHYVSAYTLPGALRYTVTTLLGRARARDGDDVLARCIAFVERYGDRLGPGDRGLLLVLLRELGLDAAPHTAAIERADLRTLDLQELSWIVWGATRTADAGDGRAAALARRAYDELLHLKGSHDLARHTRALARSHLVSFGSTVYFLRALHEYARAFDDADAHDAFARGVATTLQAQGARGEWPWMLDVASGRALDVYPVYTVHQLAMAPLFLFPAIDDGLAGATEALRRGYRWVLGENELGVDFVQRAPFLVYRSLERDERHPRATRFARTTIAALLGRTRSRPRRTRINREWRSYEAGWLLYAWADQGDELAV